MKRAFQLVSAVAVFALFALGHVAYVHMANKHLADATSEDRMPFLGTWTDETGEEGNFITFGVVRRPAPGPIPGLELWEGRVTCHNFLDGNEGEGVWGYENLQPLRLNISVGDRGRVAAVKLVDRDHLRIRFIEDLPFEKWHDALRSPEARVLTRVQAGAEPPQADRKEAP